MTCSRCIVLLNSAQNCLKWHKWAEKCPFMSTGLSRHMGLWDRRMGAVDMSLGEAFSALKGRGAKANSRQPCPWAKPTMADFAHGCGQLRRSQNWPPNRSFFFYQDKDRHPAVQISRGKHLVHILEGEEAEALQAASTELPTDAQAHEESMSLPFQQDAPWCLHPQPRLLCRTTRWKTCIMRSWWLMLIQCLVTPLVALATQ